VSSSLSVASEYTPKWKGIALPRYGWAKTTAQNPNVLPSDRKAPHVVGVLGLLAFYLGGIDQDEGALRIVEPHQRRLGVELGKGAVDGSMVR